MKPDEQTDLFLSLSPEKVLDAVEAAGLRCNPVSYPLNSFENRVYEVELEDRTRIIAKFYRPGRWSQAQILEEHQFLQDLQAAEVPVCPTLPFPDGSTLQTIDGIHYCLFARKGGRAPDELTDRHAERLGMLTARLHNVGAQREAQHRIHLTPERYIDQNIAWLEEHNTLPLYLKDRYLSASRAISAIAKERMKGVEMLRLHGDMHLGNLLLRDGVFNTLDFDDMVVGPPVQDLWMLFPGRDIWAKRQREIFLEAYAQFRDFDRRTLRLIEPLRGMRMIHYTTWLARRWHDPIFPRTWPHFNTPDYWQNETSELEDLLQSIQKEEPSSAGGTSAYVSQEPEPEGLTNADYFFDWED